MAKVQLANVAVLDNPSPFSNPFQFEVTFECIEELKEGKYQCNRLDIQSANYFHSYYFIYLKINWISCFLFGSRLGMENDLRW